MKRCAMAVVFLTLLGAVALSSQAQAQMPKPSPELKKIEYFAGSWTMEGDMKPGPMGPGGKWTGSENMKWMDGGFFLVSQSSFKSESMGTANGTAYMGYDENAKMFTYDAFNTMGEAEHAKGMLDGDNWSWTSEEKMGGQSFKSRYSMKILSPTSYTMKYEMSQDGANWNTVMEGKATKK